MDKRELLVAKKIIIMYLSNERTGMRVSNEIHRINEDDDVLREYLKAVKDIFEKAIDQIDEDTELLELL